MACDQTNSTGIGAKCDRSCAGAPSAAANGCRPGSPVSPRREAELHQIGSTQTLERNGDSATAAIPMTGDDPDADAFALWIGLRNTIAITAGFAVVMLGGCELLRRIVS